MRNEIPGFSSRQCEGTQLAMQMVGPMRDR